MRGNKKKAESLLQEQRRIYSKKAQSNPTLGGDIFFSDYMEMWLDVVRPTVKPSTFRGYKSNVNTVIVPHFSNLKITLKELTADHIDEFYSKQLERVKPNTVIQYHNNILAALKYAAKDKKKPYYKENIMEQVDKPRPNKYKAKYLNEKELVRLLKVVAGTDIELPILLAAFYGLRRGEVYGLRWSRIDFTNNRILIDQTVHKNTIDGKYQFVFSTPKTDKSLRSLPLHKGLKGYLEKQRDEQQEYRKIFSKGYSDKYLDYVFVDAVGELLDPGNITRRFPSITQSLGLGKMRFHDLRHTCASLLLAKGVSLSQIQELLGHSNIETTGNIYSHLDYTSKIQTIEHNTWISEL